MGLYFEDFEIGQHFLTANRVVHQADTLEFARLTGDWNPVHFDAAYAAATPMRTPVVHGPLTLALVFGLQFEARIHDETSVALLGIDNVRFVRPVRFGDGISVQIEVVEKRGSKRGEYGIVVFRDTVMNQRGEVVMTGERTNLIRRRNATAQEKELAGAC